MNQEIQKLKNFYNNRYDLYGNDIKTVGWGDEQSQNLRFDMLFKDIDITNKIVLDIGCGFGDLIPYLDNRFSSDYQYIGVDIAEKIISEAKKNFSKKNRNFITGDLLTLEIPNVDIAILSGALSFKREGIEKYAINTIDKMYKLSNEVACLNFMTTKCDYQLEKNQHYNPKKIYSHAKKCSSNVLLNEDYPLYEFTIQIFREG
tara:strand:- start:161 stop:769 length:609 start_codon:yes stop_codon:yes gene_type:complete